MIPFGRSEAQDPEGLKPVARDTFGGHVHVERDTKAAVTPLGQSSFFFNFLKVGGVFDSWVEECPLHDISNNAPDKRAVLATSLLGSDILSKLT